MSARRRSRRPHRSQTGSISGFVAVIMVALFAFAGLVIDGSRLVAGKVSAADHAGNAARVGAQEVLLLRDGRIGLDAAKASAAAHNYLASQGLNGVVSASTAGITVTVSDVVAMTMLGLVGVGSKSVSASRSAQPVNE